MPSRPSQRRTPRPSRIGTCTTWRVSMRSAATKSRTTVGPPPMRTSRSPAASRARSSASCGEASTKWNTVPPSISIDGRAWCVSTNTGVWNGGFGPHQPRHSSSVPTSVHGPVCAPNLPRPMISAPNPSSIRSANEWSTPTVPPASPTIERQKRVAKYHSCRRWPAWPNGASNVRPSPVPNPSREIEKLWTRTWDMAASEALGDCDMQLVAANLTEALAERKHFGGAFMDTAPRSGCAINAAVEVLGDPWAMLVLRDIMFGNNRYFRELVVGSEEGIATNILASRLKQLVAAGLLTRDAAARRGQRAAYSLTEEGIQVLPVMVALGNWGLAHRTGERRLRVRAELLRDGGPELIGAMIDELRELHLG